MDDTLFLIVEIKVTIRFVQQSYNVIEGEGGVTLEVNVREGEILVIILPQLLWTPAINEQMVHVVHLNLNKKAIVV